MGKLTIEPSQTIQSYFQEQLSAHLDVRQHENPWRIC